jgi:hypothetical protein
VRGISYLDSGSSTPWINDIPEGAQAVLLIEHTGELPERLATLQPGAQVYVGVPDSALFYSYDGLPNVHPFVAYSALDFAVQVATDFSRPERSSGRTLFRVTVGDRLMALTSEYALSTGPVANVPARHRTPDLFSELLQIGLTTDELSMITSLQDDPNAPALAGAWFDSKRQVALTVAGGCIASAIAAFIGDATVVGTAHGVFSDAPETAAVAGMTAVIGGCGVVAFYYLSKVRRIANRSLRVQHLLNRRGRSL